MSVNEADGFYCENIFYFNNIGVIGGIETFFYNLARKYRDRDITILYRTGNEAQIKRYLPFARIKRYEPGLIIKCKKVFFNYPIDIINEIEAEEYYQIIHANYEATGLSPHTHEKFDGYIAVSVAAAEAFEKQTGIKPIVCYNPVLPAEKQLLLVSATRLTKEKGKKRIEKLARLLDENNVNYKWLIFTNDTDRIKNRHIAYFKPTLDVTDLMKRADYVVQLSDDEAFCYTVVESLMVGTPVIVTDCPVFKEVGVNKKNGFILDFDLSAVPIESIVTGLPPFKYTPPADNWGTLMTDGKSTYETATVKTTQEYYDLFFKRNVAVGEMFTIEKSRAEYLKQRELVIIIGE